MNGGVGHTAWAPEVGARRAPRLLVENKNECDKDWRPERKTMAEVDPELRARWARPKILARSFGTFLHYHHHHKPPPYHHAHHQLCIRWILILILWYYLPPAFSVGTKPMVILPHLDHHHCFIPQDNPTTQAYHVRVITMKMPDVTLVKNLCNGLMKAVATPRVWVVRAIILLNLCQIRWLKHLQMIHIDITIDWA